MVEGRAPSISGDQAVADARLGADDVGMRGVAFYLFAEMREIDAQILAVILVCIAAYFLWRGNIENAFLTAVFGAVAFFLSVRFQVHERMKERKAEREEDDNWDEEEVEDDSETSLLNEIPANKQTGDEQRTTDNKQKI